jgi:hypothetical protein
LALDLSDPAGAHCRRFSGWRSDRHFRALDGSMAIAAPDFRKLFVDDAQKWAKVMYGANIKAE